jgi:CMP/dCMP kinase
MVDKLRHIITIDGPSGVGKGTLSQFLAKHLKWSFLDSGALYRVVAYYANSIGLEPEDLEKSDKDENILQNILQDKLVNKIKDFKIEFRTDPPHPKWGVSVLLNGDDVTDYVRSEECGKKASFFAKKQEVRSALFNLQRSFGAPNNLVADGRDMGRVVFPEADLKLFLTASDEVRANRRYQQLSQANISAKMSAILCDLKARDDRDRTRSVSPLKPADDAIIIDTSDLSVTQVQKRVLEHVNKIIQD